MGLLPQRRARIGAHHSHRPRARGRPMTSPSFCRALTACILAAALVAQLDACSRAAESQTTVAGSPPVAATAGQAEPRTSAPATSDENASQTETAKPGGEPRLPTGKDEKATSMPHPGPAKPSFDPRKGFEGLDPPRILQA